MDAVMCMSCMSVYVYHPSRGKVFECFGSLGARHTPTYTYIHTVGSSFGIRKQGDNQWTI